MNTNNIETFIDSFLTPKSSQKTMDLKELFSLFEQMENSNELLSEQGFTSLSNIGMEKPLRGKEESYKTDFYASLQAALGTKTSASNASDSLLQIINEINSLKNKESWANYKLSQTISVITFIESLYNMIYNIQGDNPDVAGKMFERFIAFATNGRVSSQLALIDPETAKQVGATSTSIFDLITGNNEYVSVKLLKEFKITGSINNLYKYLFNVEDSYTPINIETLDSIKTDKSITYLVTIKGTDKEELKFYSFVINCDNFVEVITAKKIEDYNNSVSFKEKIEGLNKAIELLKEKEAQIDDKISDPQTTDKEDFYQEIKEIRKQIDYYLSQREKITKGNTSFSIYSPTAAKYKQSLWDTVLKVEIDEKDLIVQNSRSIFDGSMKRLIDEASAVYYKVSNMLLKIEDENVSLQDKIAIGKEAHSSVVTLEKDIVSISRQYGVNVKQKETSTEETPQTKLF
jgi:hypothetical protein